MKSSATRKNCQRFAVPSRYKSPNDRYFWNSSCSFPLQEPSGSAGTNYKVFGREAHYLQHLPQSKRTTAKCEWLRDEFPGTSARRGKAHDIILERNFHRVLFGRALCVRSLPTPSFALHLKRRKDIRQPFSAERRTRIRNLEM